MISTLDQEYEATKRIKQGRAALAAPFDELARWVSSKWQVTVLNVVYDGRSSHRAPRLQIIVEHETEAQKFRRGGGFDRRKRRAIKDKLLEIIGRDDIYRFELDDLFVVFSAFAPLARRVADDQISDEEIRALKDRIANPDLWEISRCLGHVTFFFFTDEQWKRCEAEGKKVVYARMYFDLLRLHDEFGYLDKEEFAVAFDSKENLDENYQGSWFYYYR